MARKLGSVAHDAVMDDEITKQVLEYMRTLLPEARFRKVTRRTAINQAAYGVAKLFGHLSSFHDLYFWHPSMKKVSGIPGPEVIQVPVDSPYGLGTVNLYFRMMLLGRESKTGATGTSAKDRLSGNTAMANQIEIDMRDGDGGGTRVVVTMHLTWPAFQQLLLSLGMRVTLTAFNQLVRGKWGEGSASYGIYGDGDREGYRYLRLMNGMPKIFWPGIGWMRPG